MKRIHLSLLVCPCCRAPFRLDQSVAHGDDVERGWLICSECQNRYPIVDRIPRFVSTADNGADSFGYQWARHATTQHDQFSGTSISRDRFFQETRWPSRLDGQRVLEIGCGSGRFTTHALETGAIVVSVDISRAVDENERLHAGHKNLLTIQADLNQLPLKLGSFDRLFCLGVLQHTANVERAFKTLPMYLKPNGRLALDVYDRREGWQRWIESVYRTYYWVRPFTRRMPDPLLYHLVQAYVDLLWPVSRQIARIPRLGRILNRLLLIHDYRERFELSEQQLKQWAILDTFDNLAPQYDQRQSLSTVRRWFTECDVTDVDVHYGYNGIEGRATKC